MKKVFEAPTMEIIAVRECTIRTSPVGGGSLSVGSDDSGEKWGALVPLW